MMQRMEAGRRGLSGPVAPHALIFACHSLVLSVNEVPRADVSPWT
jgi:hypothetical protein